MANFQTVFAFAYFAVSAFFLFVTVRYGTAYGRTQDKAKYWSLIVLYAAMFIFSLWLIKTVIHADSVETKYQYLVRPPN